MDRSLLGDDPRFLFGGLLLVPLHRVDPAHDRARLIGLNPHDLAGTAFVAPGEDNDPVALFDFCRHHNTSGASEMIFIWFLARNSRGTGPKMRVPTGSDWLLINNAALGAKRMREPAAGPLSVGRP